MKISEVEVQQNFLVALYLLDKENPDGHFGHLDIARNGSLEDMIDGLTLVVIPQLQDKRWIRIMGFGSQLQTAITPTGREEAEKILSENEG
ncbi:hypothetical protein IBX73_10470 [candidate division WOR-3 bacterium]|nr:hypothetical protein [candidate division WOR-3 bacterium]